MFKRLGYSSFKVFPAPAALDVGHGNEAYVVLRGDLSQKARITEHGNSLDFGELSHPMRLAFVLAPLRNLVGHVGLLVAQE